MDFCQFPIFSYTIENLPNNLRKPYKGKHQMASLNTACYSQYDKIPNPWIEEGRLQMIFTGSFGIIE